MAGRSRSSRDRASEAVETQRKAIALVPDTEGSLRAQFESDLARYVEAAKTWPASGR